MDGGLIPFCYRSDSPAESIETMIGGWSFGLFPKVGTLDSRSTVPIGGVGAVGGAE